MVHRGEVRGDWNALRKKREERSYRVTGVTWVSLKASQQGELGEVGKVEGGWVDRERGGRDNRVPSPTLCPCVSLPVPGLSEGSNEGL